MPLVAFRVDAAVAIGLGHLIRCLTLAGALRAQGWQTRFLISKATAAWGSWITNARHGVGVLEFEGTNNETTVDYGTWDWSSDTRATRRALAAVKPDWLVVDHYGLASAWEAEMRRCAGRIMVIDDLANREHDCDLLLDQNPKDPDSYRGLLPARTIEAIGPRYALIRPEFLAVRCERSTERNRRLNVFMGGTDPFRSILFVLKEMIQRQFNELGLDVIAGSKSPGLSEVRRLIECLPTASLHIDTDQMATLFAAADVAIGAGGIAALERCSVGLPTIAISVAANQEAGLSYLSKQGAAIYLGPSNRVQEGEVTKCLSNLLDDADRLRLMSERALALVDGQGATRVARMLQ